MSEAFVQRIFSGMAIVAILFLVANVLVGLAGPDYNAAFLAAATAKKQLSELEKDRTVDANTIQQARAARDAAMAQLETVRSGWNGTTTHILLGSVAAVMTLLVNSISITYFVGTSRWSKEVVDTYHLNAEWGIESAKIKRRSFPWAVFGSLVMLAIVALGAAADPSGMNHVQSKLWVQPHYLTALTGIVIIAWSFWKQWNCLSEHFQLIEKIMVEVRRIRQERHLEVGV
jgi:hypothetical protein